MTLLARSFNYLKLHEKCCTAFLHERKCENLIVETTSIDTEFTLGEPIDFMKIDVQGEETRVLLGADGMLRTRSINLLL